MNCKRINHKHPLAVSLSAHKTSCRGSGTFTGQVQNSAAKVLPCTFEVLLVMFFVSFFEVNSRNKDSFSQHTIHCNTEQNTLRKPRYALNQEQPLNPTSKNNVDQHSPIFTQQQKYCQEELRLHLLDMEQCYSDQQALPTAAIKFRKVTIHQILYAKYCLCDLRGCLQIKQQLD